MSTSRIPPLFTPDVSFENDGIRAIVARENALIKAREERQYATINVAAAMEDLSLVSKLLFEAYITSKGFPCCVQVVDIKSNYQNLIVNSCALTNDFVLQCISALKAHLHANSMANEGKLNNALRVIASCAQYAHEMALNSNKLVQAAETLCSQSMIAFHAAQQNERETNEKQATTNATIHSLKEEARNCREQIDTLKGQIECAKKDEIKAKEAAESAAWQGILVDLIHPLLIAAAAGAAAAAAPAAGAAIAGAPILEQIARFFKNKHLDRDRKIREVHLLETELALEEQKLAAEKNKQTKDESIIANLESKIASMQKDIEQNKRILEEDDKALKVVKAGMNERISYLRSEVSTIRDNRTQLETVYLEVSARLAQIDEKLRNTQIQTGHLDQAIVALDLTQSTLGKIKTTFANTCLFWKEVEAHCNSLNKSSVFQLYAEMEEKEIFIEELTDSGWNWVTLMFTNSVAQEKIKSVLSEINNNMNHLPTSEEVREMLAKRIKTAN